MTFRFDPLELILLWKREMRKNVNNAKINVTHFAATKKMLNV